MRGVTGAPRDEKGMSFAEVLAAVVILGILVVAFVSVSQYWFMRQTGSDVAERAQVEAENELNRVRALVADSGGAGLPASGSQLDDAGGDIDVFLHRSPFPAVQTNYPVLDGYADMHSVQAILYVDGTLELVTVIAARRS